MFEGKRLREVDTSDASWPSLTLAPATLSYHIYLLLFSHSPLIFILFQQYLLPVFLFESLSHFPVFASSVFSIIFSPSGNIS